MSRIRVESVPYMLCMQAKELSNKTFPRLITQSGIKVMGNCAHWIIKTMWFGSLVDKLIHQKQKSYLLLNHWALPIAKDIY